MTGLVLRAARSTDAGRVGAILSAFIDDTPWMPRVHTRAEDLAFAGQMIERGWVTVAQLGGRVVGFVAHKEPEVVALYVDDACRGRGFGTALMRKLQQDRDELRLWTLQVNETAQEFYSRRGFVEIERTDGRGNDEGLPDIRLEWRRSA